MVRKLFAFTTLVMVLIVLVTGVGWTRAQVLTARPEDVRFQLLVNQPIAAPDGRSVVAGSSALVLKDRRTNQCYIVITVGRTMSMAPGDCGL